MKRRVRTFPDMPTTPERLASQIRLLRRRSGLTQARFARKLGVSQQKLSDWENAKRLRAVIEAMPLLRLLQRGK